VTRDEQLEWEARWSRPVAVAAILAALLTVASVPLFLPEDRKGIDATADFLLSIDDRPGAYMASAVVGALAVLLLIGVFLFLFRAVTARGAGVPRWFVYLVFGAPLAYAIARITYAFDVVDAADEFASSGPVRGDVGDDRARDLLDASPVIGGLQIAGTVGVAFLFVMLPLRARRVGIVSPFMGVLGAIAGALLVLPLAGVSPVIQAFWLGAFALLLLDRWPGGRGPAWETGEAEPWPTAAQRARELPRSPASAGQGAGQPPPPEAPPEPEEIPERPASRKRRKKRR
jgi:hypothetical protein